MHGESRRSILKELLYRVPGPELPSRHSPVTRRFPRHSPGSRAPWPVPPLVPTPRTYPPRRSRQNSLYPMCRVSGPSRVVHTSYTTTPRYTGSARECGDKFLVLETTSRALPLPSPRHCGSLSPNLVCSRLGRSSLRHDLVLSEDPRGVLGGLRVRGPGPDPVTSEQCPSDLRSPFHGTFVRSGTSGPDAGDH